MSGGLLLSGDVYIDRLNDDGTSTGLVGPINTTKLEVSSQAESVERISKKNDSYGQALDSVAIPQPSEVSIAVDEQPSEILALALAGEVNELSVEAGNVSDSAVVLPSGGRFVKLPHDKISGLTAKLASDGSDVAPASIEVNEKAGLIRAVSNGTLKDGGTVNVSYAFEASKKNLIKGGIKPIIKARILCIGKNLVNGEAVEFEMPLATLSPDGAIDLFSSEFVSTELSGKAILKDGETAPYYLTQKQ